MPYAMGTVNNLGVESVMSDASKRYVNRSRGKSACSYDCKPNWQDFLDVK